MLAASSFASSIVFWRDSVFCFYMDAGKENSCRTDRGKWFYLNLVRFHRWDMAHDQLVKCNVTDRMAVRFMQVCGAHSVDAGLLYANV